MTYFAQQHNHQYALFAGLLALSTAGAIIRRASDASWPADERVRGCSPLDAAGGASVSY